MSLKLTYPDLSSHKEFDNHEVVLRFEDADIGLVGFIAVHSNNLGPAVGGIRYAPYAAEDDAIYDVLRLSRGMSYKNAVAGLQLGGGKSVIMAKPGFRNPPPEFLDAMAAAINALEGRYIGAEDVGTTVENMKRIHENTPYVGGISEGAESADDQAPAAGDPSPYTAYGVYWAIRDAVAYKFGQDTLAGVRVAVKGLGNVGQEMCRLLAADGAKLFVSDIDPGRVQTMVALYQAVAVAPENNDIMRQDVDVYAPAAMGADINDETVPLLKAKIVCGCANNQLKEPRHARALLDRGILYVPDYIANLGGVKEVGIAFEKDAAGKPRSVPSRLEMRRMVKDIIQARLDEVFRRFDARQGALTTAEIADEMAREIFLYPYQAPAGLRAG